MWPERLPKFRHLFSLRIFTWLKDWSRRPGYEGRMFISGEAVLEILKILESLESLIPAEKKSEYSLKKREWEALKQRAWAEYKARERGMVF